MLVIVVLSALLGCGDGVVLVSFTSGTIAGAPTCDPDGGRFDLRESGGLLVVVVIGDQTLIRLSGGATGRCNDLRPGTVVDVRGVDSGDRIEATEVEVR
jgi:hypothetical protein